MYSPIKPLASYIKESRQATIDAMRLLISRYEANYGYPFINMKFSTLDGKDFEAEADVERDFRGPSAIFGWIQGRGLESLAMHAAWMDTEEPQLSVACDGMLAAVTERLLRISMFNEGRFVFLTTPDGRPFRMGADGRREYYNASTLPPGTTDQFTSKGLIAAGVRLGRKDVLDLGLETFRNVIAAIRQHNYRGDQVAFDPKNPASKPIPGRFGKGPWMLAMGAYALFCEICPETGNWVHDGCLALEEMLDKCVVAKDGDGLRKYDYVEYGDKNGNPWRDDQGRVYQDPGHALEFVGLAARFLYFARKRNPTSALYLRVSERCKRDFPEIFMSAFNNGFQRPAGGICKTFDLIGRKAINDDMPWWNLPETLRAAAFVLEMSPDHPRRKEVAAAAAECAAALFGPFRSPVPGIFAQTRNVAGEAVPVVPATPDADPGYHTGLALIDFINICEMLKKDNPGALE